MEGCNNLSSIFPANRLVQLPALETLLVKGCKSLKYIFSSSTATSLKQLTKLKVDGCEMMTEVIQNDEEAVDERIKSIDDPTSPTLVTFHKLNKIKVYRCKNLSSIFPPNRVVRLLALKTLLVEDCRSLKYIFSYSTARSLEKLAVLMVKGCEMMTEVIQNDEEAVDERIMVVFHSLRSLILMALPNLQGIYLGMVSFDWPLLKSMEIENCWKMRSFTSGYSATPLLNHLMVHGKLYDPTVEKEDVNTILRNAQINVDESLDLKEQGTLTITDFHLAGEHLIAHYSSWSWETIYVDDDIVEQYLIARNVPCLRKPRKTASKVVEKQDEDEVDSSDRDDDDDDDDKVDHGDDDGGDEMNIYKPRTYDVSITYDQTYRTSRFWLKGYDESKMDLPFDLVFEDIIMGYEEEWLTIEDHPYESGPYASLCPREECSRVAEELFNRLHEKGFDPTVQNHLQLFLDLLFPTIQFAPENLV